MQSKPLPRDGRHERDRRRRRRRRREVRVELALLHRVQLNCIDRNQQLLATAQQHDQNHEESNTSEPGRDASGSEGQHQRVEVSVHRVVVNRLRVFVRQREIIPTNGLLQQRPNRYKPI